MSGLYGFASRLSGCMAGLCAILALLALPSRSQADMASDCQACCRSQGFVDQQLSECVGFCMQGSGPCGGASAMACDVTCTGSYPLCGNGKCNAKAACNNYSCLIKVNIKQCECAAQ